MSEFLEPETGADQQASPSQKEGFPEEGFPALPALPNALGNARWRVIIKYARLLLKQTFNEMEEYCDERSERWQESDKGGEFIERMGWVEESVGYLEDFA